MTSTDKRLPLVPVTLGSWSYESIAELCSVGRFEGDRHDFKYNLAGLHDATKICCAFANTFGGFIIVGVKDAVPTQFEIVGLEPNKELYGHFRAKVKADPDIDIPPPKAIEIPDSDKLLYVFEIPQSPRPPHLPSAADRRFFWKRHGSDCTQMTLEEIRYQMNLYEEKREKLSLLLIDLHHKLRSIGIDASTPDGHYSGTIYSFEIIDRVVVETYAILREDVNIFGYLDTIKQQLSLLNAEKQIMLTFLTLSYAPDAKNSVINGYRELAKRVLPAVTLLSEQIERSLNERLGIVNPYKISK